MTSIDPVAARDDYDAAEARALAAHADVARLRTQLASKHAAARAALASETTRHGHAN